MIDPSCHDYTHQQARWGWAIVRFEFLSAGTVSVSAFGFKNAWVGTKEIEVPIEVGEHIALSMPDGTALYEILSIGYGLEPDDLYKAELRYIQHLTGIRVIASTDDSDKHRRALAWGKKISATHVAPGGAA